MTSEYFISVGHVEYKHSCSPGYLRLPVSKSEQMTVRVSLRRLHGESQQLHRLVKVSDVVANIHGCLFLVSGQHPNLPARINLSLSTSRTANSLCTASKPHCGQKCNKHTFLKTYAIVTKYYIKVMVTCNASIQLRRHTLSLCDSRKHT